MKKLLFILLMLPVLCFAQDAKEKATKMDAFASQTGMIIKLSDFSLPSIQLLLELHVLKSEYLKQGQNWVISIKSRTKVNIQLELHLLHTKIF